MALPTIRFRSINIYGTVLQGFVVGAPATQQWLTQFAGVNGVSEIRGGVGMREIVVPIVLHNVWRNRPELHNFVHLTLNRNLLNKHGVLEYRAASGTFLGRYANCTFKGFDETPPGYLLDAAGTLDGGWFVQGMLKFLQLLNL